MTREDAIRAIFGIEHALTQRTVILRPIIVDLKTPPIFTLYRGSVYAPPIGDNTTPSRTDQGGRDE